MEWNRGKRDHLQWLGDQVRISSFSVGLGCRRSSHLFRNNAWGVGLGWVPAASWNFTYIIASGVGLGWVPVHLCNFFWFRADGVGLGQSRSMQFFWNRGGGTERETYTVLGFHAPPPPPGFRQNAFINPEPTQTPLPRIKKRCRTEERRVGEEGRSPWAPYH